MYSPSVYGFPLSNLLAKNKTCHVNIAGRLHPVNNKNLDSSEVPQLLSSLLPRTATAGSDVVQSGRPIFNDFFQHLWPYIGNNTVNVVFQMVKRLWRICIDQ
ncbi:hypothetical protein TNCV_4851251 [Trichonephila clavipes]|nr:hypothetical protein TNCV_4851251 [Trichonephila clavipes]